MTSNGLLSRIECAGAAQVVKNLSSARWGASSPESFRGVPEVIVDVSGGAEVR